MFRSNSTYICWSIKSTEEQLRNPYEAALNEQHTTLPTDERPTIATVEDVSQLQDKRGKEFFARAKPGFKVIIYHKNNGIILYDPINDRIVKHGGCVESRCLTQ
jgi:hypothetical protein